MTEEGHRAEGRRGEERGGGEARRGEERGGREARRGEERGGGEARRGEERRSKNTKCPTQKSVCKPILQNLVVPSGGFKGVQMHPLVASNVFLRTYLHESIK